MLWVAPLVGAWIEIGAKALDRSAERSLHLWERGLKFDVRCRCLRCGVAPLVGAWIEICCING